ncbi:MAG: hypothetical protein KDK78_02890 [Chlamydiia bacterium]|nr:hypothetical protein [Chlamydiia bacterium]
MSHDIPQIPRKSTLSKAAPVSSKPKERGAVERPTPVAPLEFPADQVLLSAQRDRRAQELEALGLTQEDLDRYVRLAKDAPDEAVDSDLVARVKANLDGGVYGKEALAATVEGIGQDLGVLPRG